MATGRRVLIAMLDGFGPDYLEASDMPTLRALMKRGVHKTVEACMPTVTNVNNVGIATGEWPRVHGITANSYFQLDTREERYMDRAELVLVPTIFEKAAAAGVRSALLTAKKGSGSTVGLPRGTGTPIRTRQPSITCETLTRRLDLGPGAPRPCLPRRDSRGRSPRPLPTRRRFEGADARMTM